jgi:glycosyltransferase involved in cell wall biosynthesis
MRILCLSRAPLDYKGGIPAYCLNLYSEKSFNVVNYSYDISKGIKSTKKRTIKGIKEKVFPSEIKFGTIAFSLGYINSILKNLSKFDVIHLQHPDPFSGICTLLSKLLKPKIQIILTWHADIYKSYIFASPFLFLLDLIIYSLSSKIIFFTPSHLNSSFIRKIFFLRKKAIIIPCCLDIKFSKESFCLRKGIKNKEEINVISIGRLVKYKGYKYAINAIKNLNEKIKYTIVGGGPLEDELKNLINLYKLNKRVHLIGEISDKRKNDILSKADIFLFPSISSSEAYGLVQIEAMAKGLPIINTYINNGVNYLAPPDVAVTCKKKNSMEITRAIDKLINDEVFYEDKSLKSKRNFSKFEINNMRNQYKKILNDLKTK